MELTREVVGALATIAAGNKVQASEVLADAAPQFAHVSSTGGQTGRHTVAVDPTHGYFAFRNEGSLVTLDGVQVNHAELTCRIEGNRLCGTGSVFKIHLESKKPLKGLWPIAMLITYRNKFEIAGWAKIDAKSFGKSPEVEHGAGQPD